MVAKQRTYGPAAVYDEMALIDGWRSGTARQRRLADQLEAIRLARNGLAEPSNLVLRDGQFVAATPEGGVRKRLR